MTTRFEKIPKPEFGEMQGFWLPSSLATLRQKFGNLILSIINLERGRGAGDKDKVPPMSRERDEET